LTLAWFIDTDGIAAHERPQLRMASPAIVGEPANGRRIR
jgi:hypothetical protein